jgi:ATP-dependent Clp protease ATP-binding subunit ClpC
VQRVGELVRRLFGRGAVLDPPPAEDDDPLDALRQAARSLRREYGWPDPDEFESDERFEAAVDLAHDLDVDELLRLTRDGDDYVVCVALAALESRDDVPADWVVGALARLRHAGYGERFLLLRAIATQARRPVIGSALSQLDENFQFDWLGSFVERRLEAGETVDEETFRRNVPLRLAPLVSDFLDQQEYRFGPSLRTAFEAWRAGLVDVEFLSSFAGVWKRPFDHPPAVLEGPRREVVDRIVEALSETPRRSVLLVGEHGVGKTALARAALERLDERLVVFEATAAAVNAGAMYIGQLEGRVKELADKLRGANAVWVFPAFEESLYAGQHARSPQGLLDALLPYVESDELVVVGELSPSAYEQLVKERPRIRSVFEGLRVRPLDEPEAIAVARGALESLGVGVRAADRVLSESFELAQQFLPGVDSPGNLIRLAGAAAADVAEHGGSVLETADVLATLSRASGLPLELLDPAARLDVDAVRRFFDERILGQDEAVECVVERITMIKAGLTDPTRPLAVFLFVGPTGTGKTEIAKALAEFLFGSAGRLVRLDMTEFQTPDSLDRLLSDSAQNRAAAPLVAAVRRDPFSVVLLDEFEKAAPPIWDVFLQVFDDGRLTDLQGRTVDFRRCAIILTSNVGSSLARGSGLGFSPAAKPFRPEAVERELARSFRPELLNRIDRVVVFRPLERGQMRQLLDKELAEALERRGLRARPWAVELDESAIRFLLDEGFSPELGARPLKRAIERHLLAPLARVIVEQSAPEGDQFLFVTAPHGRIEVAFVDPDAAEDEHVPEEVEERPLDVRSLILAPQAGPDAARFLLDQLAAVRQTVRTTALSERKQAALAAVASPGFWEDAERFAVLAEAEYLDRLEAALATGEKLGERLRRSVARNGGAPAGSLVELLANRVYVLEHALAGLAADDPPDVFLRVRPAAGADEEAASFAAALADMYARWGEARGMQVRRLADEPGSHLLGVSGLGAASILAPEPGLHVLERVEGGDDPKVERVAAVVQAAAWPPGPATDEAGLRALAEEALDRAVPSTKVVRPYRREPSPLVRDAVRGYRTGRLDRILAGDFDLF